MSESTNDQEAVKIVLDRLMLVTRATLDLPDSFAQAPEFLATVDLVARQMHIRLEQCVAGQQIDEVVISYPADWWQALKKRWFPAWARKRWPVRYSLEIMSAKALYPSVSLPEIGHMILITKTYARAPIDPNEIEV